MAEGALDVLDKPRAARVLRHLARHEPINQREFTEISRHAPEQAKRLRDELESFGLIEVSELSGHGNAGIKQIRLTTTGLEVAQHLLAIEQIAEKMPGRVVNR